MNKNEKLNESLSFSDIIELMENKKPIPQFKRHTAIKNMDTIILEWKYWKTHGYFPEDINLKI